MSGAPEPAAIKAGVEKIKNARINEFGGTGRMKSEPVPKKTP